MTRSLFLSLIFPALLPAMVMVMAGTVGFTDSIPPDVPVVLLDGPERLQAEIFGDLSADPEAAARQARQVMQSPG